MRIFEASRKNPNRAEKISEMRKIWMRACKARIVKFLLVSSDQREDLKFSATFRRKILEFESPSFLSIICEADKNLGVPPL
tara:strand:- start:240 stop:482 length:243 start_codon:yes stop_codon:yes gene_type:complete